MNETILIGTISVPQFAHEINGDRIYKAYITTKRASGVTDVIPALIPQYLCNNLTTRVMVEGEFRSHNTEPDENGHKHLTLYLYVKNIYSEFGNKDENDIQLEGYVCKTPVTRTTPSGRKITDILLATPRSNIKDRSDYIPVIAWGDQPEIKIGDKLNIKGRIQSRIYKENNIAYEVSTKELTKK